VTRVKPSRPAIAREFVRPMRIVFTTWLVGIAIGLAYMFAVVIAGR
jgi:hypothetical protein